MTRGFLPQSEPSTSPQYAEVLMDVQYYVCKLILAVKNGVPDVFGTLNLSHCRQANIIMQEHRGKIKNSHLNHINYRETHQGSQASS